MESMNKNIESQPFCPECTGPKNHKGGFDHYENCSLVKEGGETKEEEFVDGEIKENPDLPESEFVKYYEQKKINKEAGDLLKDAFVKKVEKKEEPKLEISAEAGMLVKKIWEMELEPRWDIIINRGDAREWVSNLVEREINLAIKEGRLPSNKDKEVLDMIELKCIEGGLPGCEIIIHAKSKSYMPMESTTEERIKNIKERIKKEQKKRK